MLAGELARARTPSEIATAVRAAGPEAVAVAGALGPADSASAWLERLRDVRLEINGADLAAAGVPEGPAIGIGLRAALAAKLDGRAPTRAAELGWALKAAQDSG
jgi:tRNA nucleotidyltransferase (CCA-adding enzyme)